MKKTILSIIAASPVSAYAQAAPASSDGGFGLMTIVLVIVLIVAVFLLCREIVCWYWKINKSIANQEEIIRLLKKIAGEGNSTTSNNQAIIDPFHK